MKRKITLAVLGLLSLVGGSWLAAQQRELDPARPSAPGASDVTGPEDPAGKPARLEDKSAKPRRASSPSLQRSTSATPDQAVIATTERYSEDGADFTNKKETLREFNVAGQALWLLPESRRRRSAEELERMREFQDAIKELREADSEEDKVAARDQVNKLVSEQLEIDLANREKELAAIERRAKELREQLEERKTAKPELLKMLVMLIENPQVGLGIPPEWMQLLLRGQPDRDYRVFNTLPVDALPYMPPQLPTLPQPPAPRR